LNGGTGWAGAYATANEARDWANRVTINGGAAPSAGNVTAAQTFVDALKTAGIWSKMISINMLAPDNAVALKTPLLKGAGSDPWNFVNYVDGTMRTANGYKGLNSGYAITGVQPSSAFPSAFDAGLTVYIHTGVNENYADMGVNMAGDYLPAYQISTSYANDGAGHLNYLLADVNNSAYRALASNSAGVGYHSANRIAQSDFRVFKANSGVAHFELANNLNACVDKWASVTGIINLNLLAGVGGAGSKTISFAAIHRGLTSSESQAFYNAIQALRTSFGGGYV
jgi:hypothetical protein